MTMRINTLQTTCYSSQLILALAAVIAAPTSFAQTVPAELLDLSIEDLFETRVTSSTERSSNEPRWSLEIGYDRSEFNEYFIGSSKVSYDDVLFQPGSEPRTNRNYPVAPTKIQQTVQSIRLAYGLSPTIT